MRALLFSPLLAFGALAIASNARAETPPAKPRPLTLAWDAPAGCPSREDVEGRISRLLAGSQRDDAIDASVSIARVRDDLWSARLRTRIRGVVGERALSAASCDLAASASALVIALAFDPDLIPEPPAIEAPPPSPPSPPPPAPSAPPPAPPSVAPRATESRLAIGAWIAADTGSLPALAPGAGASVGVAHGALDFDAYVEAWTKQTASSADRAGAGGDFDLVDAGLRACAHDGATIVYGACIGAEVDRLHGVGFGVNQPSSTTRAWIAPRAGLSLGVQLSENVSLPIHVDALVPLPRPSFALENVGSVFRPSAVAVRATFGVAVHF